MGQLMRQVMRWLKTSTRPMLLDNNHCLWGKIKETLAPLVQAAAWDSNGFGVYGVIKEREAPWGWTLYGHPRENGDPVGSRLRENDIVERGNDKRESGNDIVERRYHATNLETPSETRNSAWSSS